MLHELSRYVKVYLCQIKNNWVREMVYRTNFLTSIIVDLIWLGVEFSLFTVIYSNTTSIGGWGKEQVYFFLGVLFSSDALFTIFFTRNMWMFNDLVNKGDLDILLTKPLSAVFLALTRWINLTAITNFILGVLICVKFSDAAGFRGGFLGWSLFAFWVTIGLFSALLIRFLFSVLIFWTDRAWALSRLYYQFFGFATKPDVIFPRGIKYLIMTVLPFGFIGSVPARALLNGLQLHEYFIVATVLVVFSLLNYNLWQRGLRRYQSASS